MSRSSLNAAPPAYVDDPDFVLYVGDVRDVLTKLPSESVDCCVTSPPYWGLRDYGAVDQLGLEAAPEEYVARMVGVFREVRRVLRKDGTLWLNIGDSYAGQAGGSQGQNGQRATRTFTAENLGGKIASGLKSKDLVGIPWRLAFALQADGWYLRSDIIWSKPNPMPESVTDRPTKAHEYLFLLTKSARYFYDADAIREPLAEANAQRTTARYDTTGRGPKDGGNGGLDLLAARMRDGNHGGRNKRSVWEIATQPYPDAHFATFPEELPRLCIAAGTSERGCCPECGAPWEREISQEPNIHPGDSGRNDVQGEAQRGKREDGKAVGTIMRERHDAGRARTTTGWKPTCRCDDHPSGPCGACEVGLCAGGEPLPPVPSVVLDPFMGSGTTALVARRLGRKAVGVELNPDYAELCARRLGQQSLLTEGAA